MKLTKQQLKQIIKEEIENVFVAEASDVGTISKGLDSSGLRDRIKNLVNTPKEFEEILALMIDIIELPQGPRVELQLLRRMIPILQKKVDEMEKVAPNQGVAELP